MHSDTQHARVGTACLPSPLPHLSPPHPHPIPCSRCCPRRFPRGRARGSCGSAGPRSGARPFAVPHCRRHRRRRPSPPAPPDTALPPTPMTLPLRLPLWLLRTGRASLPDRLRSGSRVAARSRHHRDDIRHRGGHEPPRRHHGSLSWLHGMKPAAPPHHQSPEIQNNSSGQSKQDEWL